MRDKGQNLECEKFWQHKNEDFPCWDYETPEQVVQGGCGISILGDIQNSGAWGPKKPDLLGYVVSWRRFSGASLQIVWFCNSYKNW